MVREAEDGERTAERLREAGFAAALLPLTAIRPLDPAPPAGPVAALVATSRHAVPWLARHFGGHALAVLAVGEATAAALRAAGFVRVLAGAGRAADLAALAATLPVGEGEAILYAAGRVRLPDCEAGFAAASLPLRVVEVYDTVPRHPGESERATLREAGPIAGALVFSRAQARALEALLSQTSGLLSEDATYFCLSEAIALELSPQFGKNAVWAERPTLASLVEAIHRWNGRLGG